MRPRMSDVHTERYSPMYPAVDAFEAEREARSILADAEPRTFLPSSHFARKVKREGWLNPTAFVAGHLIEERYARKALAESLRSFVEGC